MAISNPLAQARTRGGFTAVELLMVMGVMLIIMAMTAPAILPALRHGKVSSACNDISACWQMARSMAMGSSIPTGPNPYHYGIVINQPGSGQESYVALIYDNENIASPRLLTQGEDPTNVSTYNASQPAVAQFYFNRNVVLATATATGIPLSTAPGSIVVYAQYGTGLPLNPADVANQPFGRGLVAEPTSFGLSGMLNSSAGAPTPATPPPSIMPVAELQTIDFVNSPRRGYAMAIALYHAGFLSMEDL